MVTEAPEVVVVIPALDEEAGLARVLADLAAACPKDRAAAAAGPRGAAAPTAFRLRGALVVDNGSADRTAETARGLGATVIAEPRRGYGAACLAGLAFLKSAPPDIVAFIDADHSDDATDLSELLRPILEGRADLVIGSRALGEREPGALTAVQAFGNRLATFLLRILFGARFTDLGPFRAVRWSSLESLGMRDRDYGWTVEMQARAAARGLRCAEVPVRYRRRRAGRSKVSGTLRGMAGAGWKIVYTIARVRLGG